MPFKFTEAISAIKGLEAAFACAIAQARYGADGGHVTINTDHAALFVFSAFTTTLNGMPALDPRLHAVVNDWDIANSSKHRYRQLCTNVYRTKDGRYFHLHGSMDARPSMKMLRLDPDRLELKTREEIVPIYTEAVAGWESMEIDRAANEEYKQAGTVCYTYDGMWGVRSGQEQIARVHTQR